jgi:ABC-type multidrug transport system fused ATPase/permease subunit
MTPSPPSPLSEACPADQPATTLPLPTPHCPRYAPSPVLFQACPLDQPATSVRIAAASFTLLALAFALLLWGCLGTPAPPKPIPTLAAGAPSDGPGRDGNRRRRREGGGLGGAGVGLPPTVSVTTTTPPHDVHMASAEEGRGGYGYPRANTPPASPPASPPTNAGPKTFAPVVPKINLPFKKDAEDAPSFPPLPELLDAVRPVPSPPPALAFHVTVVPENSPVGALLPPIHTTASNSQVPSKISPAASSLPRPILAPVRLRLRPGETHGVFGPSGSGKSTLLSALAGDPSGGLRVDGKISLGGGAAEELPRGTIGYCAQVRGGRRGV